MTNLARRALGFVVVLLAMTLLGACNGSGQTGSPECVESRAECVCGAFGRNSLAARAHVTRVDGAVIDVELDEIFSDAQLPALVRPGATLSGTFHAGLRCSELDVEDPVVGDTVLVTRWASNLTDKTPLEIVPWADPIRFGTAFAYGDITVPMSRVSDLAGDQCRTFFPVDTCDDTPDTGVFACNVAAATTSSTTLVVVCALATALALGARRQRRRQAQKRTALRGA